LVVSRGADNTEPRENSTATNVTQDVDRGGVAWNDTDLGKRTWRGTCLSRPGSFISQICREYRSIGTTSTIRKYERKRQFTRYRNKWTENKKMDLNTLWTGDADLRF